MSWLHVNDRPGAYPESWYAATATPLDPFPPLKGAVEADLCIVGGGYTGLSAALHAAQAGLSVVLLEAQRVGFGASGRNGGQIGSGFNTDQAALEAKLGRETARDLWALTEEAKALVRSLIATHAPEADYRPGVLHGALSKGDAAGLRDVADHLAAHYGVTEAEVLGAEAMAEITGSTAFQGGVLDRSAGYCHPLRYALGLARAAEAAGAVLHERSEVHHVAPGTVRCGSGQVNARHILLACNGYSQSLNRAVAARVLPINNYIAVTEPLGDRAPMTRPVAVADGRFVVNYWWQTADGRLVYGGGESYGRRFPKNIAGKVRANMARIYPQLRDVRFTHAWGGTLAVTASRLPHVAEVAPGVLSAAGYSGHGVALATLCGKLAAEVAAGTRDRFDRMARLPVPALPGGALFGPALTTAGMLAYALRDRLGL